MRFYAFMLTRISKIFIDIHNVFKVIKDGKDGPILLQPYTAHHLMSITSRVFYVTTFTTFCTRCATLLWPVFVKRNYVAALYVDNRVCYTRRRCTTLKFKH